MLLAEQRLHHCSFPPTPAHSHPHQKALIGQHSFNLRAQHCQQHTFKAASADRACRTQRHRSVFTQAAAEAAPPADTGSPKIRIKLKSYWKGMLSDAVDHIKEAATSTNASFSGPVYLPTRKKVFTVLTSPHVNKDAREQFEIRTHSRLMDIKDLTPETIDRLMFLELPSGVNVEVKL